MATKKLTLARLLDDPDSQALFDMDNVEEYKGYDIYDHNGDTTMATKLVNGGVHALHVKGIGVEYREAMKAKIDAL